jgi:hypothetical protein
MITEYPLEHQRYDQPEYEPFWTAAAALNLPLSLHTATRRQGRIRGADDEQAKITGGNTARVYNFDVARLTTITIAKTR